MINTVDELVTALAKPIFVYRMAKGDIREGESKQKRLHQSSEEIDRIVFDYVGHKQHLRSI